MGCFIYAIMFGVLVLLEVFLFNISPVLGVISIVAFIIWTLYSSKKDKDKKETEDYDKRKKFEELIKNIDGFTPSQKYVSKTLDSSIMIDEANKKVCLVHSDLTQKLVLNYKDILEAEIIEDGNTITKTSRSSQLGGALIGGILAGGVGAIIGGLSGEKSSEEEAVRVDLKVVINNTKEPIQIINFLLDDRIDPLTMKPFGINKKSQTFKDAMKEVNHWHSLLSVVIRMADAEDEKTSVPSPSSSVADELRKLSDLVKEGLLTEDEYKQQKENVLKNLSSTT